MDDNYDMYWGIITYKGGNTEAIIATSEEAYYAYEKYYEGSRVSMPNYGYLDSIRDFDDEMLSEIHYAEKQENKKLIQKEIAQLKIDTNLTEEEKVSIVLSRMQELDL
tara:strand:- start:238 stop:561 length:324 start_codon:yes stop_codon:yes gene_type:complete